VSDLLHGLPLVRRIVAEHRQLVIGLAIALVANILIYVFVVYPLGQRVANIEQRNAQAEQELAAARSDHAQASGTLTGKDRASTELTTFYSDVLPADEAGARRLTFLRIRQLADESDLGFERGLTEIEAERDRTLARLRSQIVLAGSWDNVRAFIYQLETAPEFVVIDNVELAESATGGTDLVVTVDLSTYFRAAAEATPAR
jgi:F0F1-type ATP synthase membrane subunit b/b'